MCYTHTHIYIYIVNEGLFYYKKMYLSTERKRSKCLLKKKYMQSKKMVHCSNKILF